MIEKTVAEIKELIEPLFQKTNIYLLEVKLRGNVGSRVLNIYADTESGITLDEIARMTREINELLDECDCIKGRYRLEVSSPGVDRSLEHLWEFRKNIGRNLWVLFDENREQCEASGRLAAVDEEKIILRSKQTEVAIPLLSIVKARVKLKW